MAKSKLRRSWGAKVEAQEDVGVAKPMVRRCRGRNTEGQRTFGAGSGSVWGGSGGGLGAPEAEARKIQISTFLV